MQPYVDYTLLKPDATIADYEKLCLSALRNNDMVRAVCVLPDPVVMDFCRRLLGSSFYRLDNNVVADLMVKVCVVNDFPLGRSGYNVREISARLAKSYGVQEIDTVLNAGLLLDKNYKEISLELAVVTNIFPDATKVIIETGHPWHNEYLIKKATELVAESGAFCVKTSTGFIANIPIQQKVQHVKWMHEAAPGLVIKVAGGVKTMADAELFFDVVPRELLIFGASADFWKKKAEK